jgi:hypothetical protein
VGDGVEPLALGFDHGADAEPGVLDEAADHHGVDTGTGAGPRTACVLRYSGEAAGAALLAFSIRSSACVN